MRKEDPIEKEAANAIDPGEPGPRPPVSSGFTAPEAEDPGEPGDAPPEEGGEQDEGALELPEGTVLLYDETGQPFLGIPIDPADVPEDPEEGPEK